MAANIIGGDIKDLLSIKIKSRYDNFGDQFHRILMVKVLLVCSLIMGMSWFKDSINCIVPESANIDAEFVSAACWIQGVYIYRDMSGRIPESAYYGMPKEMNMDGLTKADYLCQSKQRSDLTKRPENHCSEMEKTFYLQYQWLPFYVAGLSVLYYLPYIIYCNINVDLRSLRDSIKEGITADKIAESYFDRKPTTLRMHRFRVLLNILSKLLYLGAGVFAFVSTDWILYGNYTTYGIHWMNWSKLNNTIGYDYMGSRDHPKPGNVLLPPFGYCEVWESALDKLIAKTNQFKFVCEMSQNILYQYCFIVLWWLMIIGLIFAVLGLLWLLLKYVLKAMSIRRYNSPAHWLYKHITIRQMEYLNFIRKKDIPLYNEVIEELRKDEYFGQLVDKVQKRGHAPMM